MELPKGGFLYINDEVPEIKRARILDPHKHCFNPLKDIDYRKARELAELLYTIAPQGENTLTVRNGKRALLKALLEAKTLDKVKGDDEVRGMIGDLLVSPLLRQVLCNPTNFSFNQNSVILARINRVELGDFDSLVLGLFLISQFQGQIVVPDFGFYGRDAHMRLIREGRLIAGVNTLNEMPPKLRQAALLIRDKVGSGTTFEDAETLANYSGFPNVAKGYKDFVQDAME